MTRFSFHRWKCVSHSLRSRQALSIAMVAILSLVWSTAGALKLASLADFADGLYALEAAPWNAVPFLALYIPLVEICVAVALVAPQWRVAGTIASGCMLLVFTVVIFVHRESSNGCACFGATVAVPPWMAISRNILLLAANLYLWRVLMKNAHTNMGSGVRFPDIRSSEGEPAHAHANECK